MRLWRFGVYWIRSVEFAKAVNWGYEYHMLIVRIGRLQLQFYTGERQA